MFYLHGVTGSKDRGVPARGGLSAGARRRDLRKARDFPDPPGGGNLLAAFRSEIAVLHSGLSPSRRLNEWTRLRDGQAHLAIGARSAVFAPVRDLGLVVIDEEHEGSYKSGTTPRYHARQVAMHRARAEGAVLVMGSATPSLEAWHSIREGRIPCLSLGRRMSGGTLPEVRVRALAGESTPLTRPLIEEIRAPTRRGGRPSCS
jgi:primosomal protein N' (replication factor Y)